MFKNVKDNYFVGLGWGLVYAFAVVITLVTLIMPFILTAVYIVFGIYQLIRRRFKFVLGYATVWAAFILLCIVLLIVHDAHKLF